MADDAERMRMAQALQQPEMGQPTWWERNAHLFSPGGLMQEGLFQAGFGQTGPGYDMLKRMGGAVDTLGAVAGALPLAGRALIGKAGMAGRDASMADSMMRYTPADTLRGAPRLGPGRFNDSAGVGNPKEIAGMGGPWTTVMPPHKVPTAMYGTTPGNARWWTTPEGMMPGGHGYPLNQNKGPVDPQYMNALLAQQLRKGFEVVK